MTQGAVLGAGFSKGCTVRNRENLCRCHRMEWRRNREQSAGATFAKSHRQRYYSFRACAHPIYRVADRSENDKATPLSLVTMNRSTL